MRSIKPSDNTIKNWCYDLLFFAVIFAIFYGIWLGSHALFTPDEGRYSEVAREMLATHDFITPRLNGIVFLHKPVLYYWLQASAMKMFGISEWALRFWPALLGVFGCLMTYFAGRVLFDRRTGILSALILATSPLYYGAAHYANLDLEVAVFVSTALLFFVMGMQAKTAKQRTIFLLLAYVFSAFAALTKGLIGIVFPMMIMGLWLMILYHWHRIKELRLLIGIVIFAMITVPWYVLVQKANPQFFQFFFLTQQFSRFLTTQSFNNQVPIWFYVPIVVIGLFPWTLFVVQAFHQKIKAIWQDRYHHSTELFLLLWFTVIFIFFSIPHSKTIGYILPIFPALALLIGHYLSVVWDEKSKGISVAGLIFIGLSAVIFLVCLIAPSVKAMHVANNLHSYIYIIGMGFLVAGLLVFLTRSRPKKYFIGILTVLMVVVLLTLSASLSAFNQKSAKPLAMQIKPYLTSDDEIVTFYKYYQDLPVYLERRAVVVSDWETPMHDNWRSELWYGTKYQDTHEWLISEDAFWHRWNGKKRLFVFTDKGSYERIKQKAKNKLYFIGEQNHIILISNKKIEL